MVGLAHRCDGTRLLSAAYTAMPAARAFIMGFGLQTAAIAAGGREGPSTPNSNNSKTNTSKTVEKNKTNAASSPSKNITSTKSASQLSISHFSSVSTPEYREGWDRIWGNDKLNLNRDKVIDDNNTLPVEISLSNLDISDLTKKTILQELYVYANKNNLSLPQFKTLLLKNIEFSCTINIKK